MYCAWTHIAHVNYWHTQYLHLGCHPLIDDSMLKWKRRNVSVLYIYIFLHIRDERYFIIYTSGVWRSPLIYYLDPAIGQSAHNLALYNELMVESYKTNDVTHRSVHVVAELNFDRHVGRSEKTVLLRATGLRPQAGWVMGVRGSLLLSWLNFGLSV